MSLVYIFATCFEKPLHSDIFSEYLSVLPIEVQEKNLRYIRWQNKHSHLFGRLLLIEALKKYNYVNNIWDYIAYNSYERPYFIYDQLDFNISHSGKYVICAIGENIRLGVDIEENNNINLKDFYNIMSPDQWRRINNTDYPLKEFYKYWTIKESVIKADGRGFSLPIDTLDIINDTVECDNKLWFIREMEFGDGYSLALATSREVDYEIIWMNFSKIT
ncbi:MAG: 4'-phosphopantetheinyl transferase superfamily protein [Prevotella sp.]|jgi:4'-phosphopantetheinyl transferase|nr:4'-phosphopantetheinyl transferase superfamily protein [Prevotella sp.]